MSFDFHSRRQQYDENITNFAISLVDIDYNFSNTTKIGSLTFLSFSNIEAMSTFKVVVKSHIYQESMKFEDAHSLPYQPKIII